MEESTRQLALFFVTITVALLLILVGFVQNNHFVLQMAEKGYVEEYQGNNKVWVKKYPVENE